MKSAVAVWRFLVGMIGVAVFCSGAPAVQGLEGRGALVFSVPVPAGLSAAAVRDVVLVTLRERQWTVKEKTRNKAVGYLKHRGYEAQVTFDFDDQKVDVSCVSYAIDREGVRLRPELPKSWLNNLKSDLGKRLARSSAKK